MITFSITRLPENDATPILSLQFQCKADRDSEGDILKPLAEKLFEYLDNEFKEKDKLVGICYEDLVESKNALQATIHLSHDNWLPLENILRILSVTPFSVLQDFSEGVADMDDDIIGEQSIYSKYDPEVDNSKKRSRPSDAAAGFAAHVLHGLFANAQHNKVGIVDEVAEMSKALEVEPSDAAKRQKTKQHRQTAKAKKPDKSAELNERPPFQFEPPRF